MTEINLMRNYPRTKRDLGKRVLEKTPQIHAIARQFGKEFFDGERKYGYGGFNYDKRFWQNVVIDFKEYYALKAGDRILDVGCAKGFMMYDFLSLLPDIKVAGLDISHYAIQYALPSVRPFLMKGDAKTLPYKSKAFELVLSINTVHNLPLSECRHAIS